MKFVELGDACGGSCTTGVHEEECGYSWFGHHRGPCLGLDLRRLRLGLFSLRSGLLLGPLLLGLGPRLVDLGALVNHVEDRGGWTPLHLASSHGHLNVVDRLVELGASVHERDANGRTPLPQAYLRAHLSIVMFFLRHNALTTERFDDRAIVSFFRSRESLLAVLAYGFNQYVSDNALQGRASDDVRDLFRVVRNLCSIQVIIMSILCIFLTGQYSFSLSHFVYACDDLLL